MRNIKHFLKYIDKANKALKDAGHHTKRDKYSSAYLDIESAYRYIEEAKYYIDLEKENCHHSRCCDDCCHCCHCHHKPKPSHLTSQSFFAKVSGGIPGGNNLTIPASSFIDDMGNPVVSFPTTYEYTTLYINGMIQQNGVFIITPSSITVINGAHLDSDDPIAIEVIIQT